MADYFAQLEKSMDGDFLSQIKQKKIQKAQLAEQSVKQVQQRLQFKPLSLNEIRAKTSRDNLECVFHESKFVGNDLAAEQLCTVLFSSLENKDRIFSVGPVFFDSAPSSGKTYCAKLLSQGTGLPLVELDSNLAQSTDDIAELASKVCAANKIPLVSQSSRNGLPYFEIPPLIFFFDEFHTISDKFANGLLRAMEKNDNILTTKNGMFNCANTLWIVSTTHIGKIYKKNPALLTRFNPVIKLAQLTEFEVIKIIKIQKDCVDWTIEECSALVSWFGTMVREIIAKAHEVNCKVRHKGCTRLEAIELVAKESGVAKGGLKLDDVKVLQFLADQFPNRSTYADIEAGTQVQYDTLQGMVLPNLTTSKLGRKPFVKRRNFIITIHGANFLKLKGLIGDNKYKQIVEYKE